MHVWFYPVEEPGVYVVLRPNGEDSIFCVSDGLPMDRAIEAAGRLATIAERDWVRAYVGSPPVAEDPTYTHTDKISKGAKFWDRSMIPDGLLWTGKAPCGAHKETA